MAASRGSAQEPGPVCEDARGPASCSPAAFRLPTSDSVAGSGDWASLSASASLARSPPVRHRPTGRSRGRRRLLRRQSRRAALPPGSLGPFPRVAGRRPVGS